MLQAHQLHLHSLVVTAAHAGVAIAPESSTVPALAAAAAAAAACGAVAVSSATCATCATESTTDAARAAIRAIGLSGRRPPPFPLSARSHVTRRAQCAPAARLQSQPQP